MPDKVTLEDHAILAFVKEHAPDCPLENVRMMYDAQTFANAEVPTTVIQIHWATMLPFPISHYREMYVATAYIESWAQTWFDNQPDKLL